MGNNSKLRCFAIIDYGMVNYVKSIKICVMMMKMMSQPLDRDIRYVSFCSFEPCIELNQTLQEKILFSIP
jgi:hypothetical protein